jgi:hypothetical protein
MSIANDLRRLSAPRKVVEAGVALDEAIQARLSPPVALAAYVREWVARNMRNNRYGR